MKRKALSIRVSADIGKVSAISITPTRPICLLTIAHGAGAGMTHPFMEELATSLGETVYEIRVIDPLCNGVNSVFKVDGTPVVNSSQQSAYAIYIAGVKNLQQIWKCK